jgi:hypothetical protein
MNLTEKTVLQPQTVTVWEQAVNALQDHSGTAAVILVPDGDKGLKMYYRGVGGAWWRPNFNEKDATVLMEAELRDVRNIVLLTRADIDNMTTLSEESS